MLGVLSRRCSHHVVRNFSTSSSAKHTTNSIYTTQNMLMGGVIMSAMGLSSIALAESAASPQPEEEATGPVVPDVADAGGLPESSEEGFHYLQPRKRRTARELPNPGQFSMFGSEMREVLELDCFNGFRFELMQPLMQTHDKQFALSVNASVDKVQFPDTGKSIEFGSQVANADQLLWARVTNDYTAMGRWHQQISKDLLVKFLFRSENLFEPPQQYVCEFDYKGSDWTAHVNARTSEHGQIYGAHYLQSVSHSIALGLEGFHQVDAGSSLSFAGRYKSTPVDGEKGSGDTWFMQLNTQSMIGLQYARQLNQNVSLVNGINFQVVPNQMGMPELKHEVQWGAAYKYNTFSMKGVLSTDGSVKTNLEVMLLPVIAVTFSGELNHFDLESKFGLGMRIG